MIKSMTGYGQHKHVHENFEFTVEIKTLNSKFFDLNLRLPKSLASKEIEIRKILNDSLVRGKVVVNIEMTRTSINANSIGFNEPLFKLYYDKLSKLSQSVHASEDDIFRMVMNFPEVTINSNEDLSEEEWSNLKDSIQNAITICSQFRIQEGEALKKELTQYNNVIAQNLVQIADLDPKRIERVKSRIEQNLTNFIKEEFDQNRLEQEIIYYIEKLDIKEEIVRLTNHLKYFENSLNGKSVSGKKLGFVAQEMGREINTIGSKANDSDIQVLVVNMKEELEKIKEQVLNVL